MRMICYSKHFFTHLFLDESNMTTLYIRNVVRILFNPPIMPSRGVLSTFHINLLVFPNKSRCLHSDLLLAKSCWNAKTSEFSSVQLKIYTATAAAAVVTLSSNLTSFCLFKNLNSPIRLDLFQQKQRKSSAEHLISPLSWKITYSNVDPLYDNFLWCLFFFAVLKAYHTRAAFFFSTDCLLIIFFLLTHSNFIWFSSFSLFVFLCAQICLLVSHKKWGAIWS